jgi:hypothetical protein
MKTLKALSDDRPFTDATDAPDAPGCEPVW